MNRFYYTVSFSILNFLANLMYMIFFSSKQLINIVQLMSFFNRLE